MMPNLMVFIFLTLCSLVILVNSRPSALEARYQNLVPAFGQSPSLRSIVKRNLDGTDQVKNEKTAEKKDTLKHISTDGTKLYKLLHRSRRAQYDRYGYSHRNHYFSDDWDDAGYDRKGFDVGYMDKNDDFPTLVW